MTERSASGVTVNSLRSAGYSDEADRLERAVASRRSWNYDGTANERAVALGLFGSVRYDELAAALGVKGWFA